MPRSEGLEGHDASNALRSAANAEVLMPVFDVIPHVGIGPLRLGMSHTEVRLAVAGHTVKSLRGCQEVVRDLGLWVDYPDGFTRVSFVQASKAKGIWITFSGLEVFDSQ